MITFFNKTQVIYFIANVESNSLPICQMLFVYFGTTHKKNRILYIKRFLEKQTDEEHPATVADIIAYLSSEGITAHHRTVMLDIEQLIEAGIDVVCNKSRQNQYFIGNGLLEMPELKMLIDTVQAGKKQRLY